jgi:nicotinamide mononucleotide transporter
MIALNMSIIREFSLRNIPRNDIFDAMHLNEIWDGIVSTIQTFDFWGISALVFGLLAVYFLIKENLFTWPAGILYVLVSFIVFWNERLYGDLLLHIFYLVLNIYGWYYWVKGNTQVDQEVKVTQLSLKGGLLALMVTGIGVWVFAQFLMAIPGWFEGMEPASLPYWDSVTSMLSVTGMWLTARKKLDNWYYWFAVDVVATGVYFYKGMYFYSLLYFIYIGMAVAGYMAWKKTMLKMNTIHD